jgi:hypothetical protein
VSTVSTSLDASWPVIPTDDVSTIYFCCLLGFELFFSCPSLDRL